MSKWKNSGQYENKIILAPMVKIGTLPARLLALRYGADLVYSEEIIDWRFLRSKRIVNDMLGTIDYIDQEDDVTVFRTCQEERSKVILQIGTSDADRALRVGRMLENDIAGLDINMGCPKGFSLKGGMGAALLSKPDKIKAILTNLVENLKIPITCKIRVLNTVEETIELCKMIESCGVSAVGIHGRYISERPQHSNRNHFIREISQFLTIPVIANGGSSEIETYQDILKFRENTQTSSVMLARCAEANLSIFKSNGVKEDYNDVIKKYIKLSIETNTSFIIVKYNIQHVLRDKQDSEFGRRFLDTKILREICELWDLGVYYDEKQHEFELYKSKESNKRGLESKSNSDEENTKRIKLADDDVIIMTGCTFIRGLWKDANQLPKLQVLNILRNQGFINQAPVYTTETRDKKKFQSVIEFKGKKFTTDTFEKNKKSAEQAAALALVKYLQIEKDFKF